MTSQSIVPQEIFPPKSTAGEATSALRSEARSLIDGLREAARRLSGKEDDRSSGAERSQGLQDDGSPEASLHRAFASFTSAYHEYVSPFLSKRGAPTLVNTLREIFPELRYFVGEIVSYSLYSSPRASTRGEKPQFIRFAAQQMISKLRAVLESQELPLFSELETPVRPQHPDTVTQCSSSGERSDAFGSSAKVEEPSLADLIHDLEDRAARDNRKIAAKPSQPTSQRWKSVSKTASLGRDMTPFHAGKYRSSDPEFHKCLCVTELLVVADRDGSLAPAAQYFEEAASNRGESLVNLVSSMEVPALRSHVTSMSPVTEISMPVQAGSVFRIPMPLRYRLEALSFRSSGAAVGTAPVAVQCSIFGEYQVLVPAGAVEIRYRIAPAAQHRYLSQELCARLSTLMPGDQGVERRSSGFAVPLDPVCRAVMERARCEQDVFSALGFVADALASRRTVYTLDSEIGEVIEKAGSQRVNFLSGLAAGSCLTLSVELANHLSALGPVLVSAGITPEPARHTFLCAPGHAQVVAYGDETCRVFDPTVTTDSGLICDPKRVPEQHWARYGELAAGSESYELAREIRVKTIVAGDRIRLHPFGHHCEEDQDIRDQDRQAAIGRMRDYIQQAKDALVQTQATKSGLPLIRVYDKIDSDLDYPALERQLAPWLGMTTIPRQILLSGMKAYATDLSMPALNRRDLISWAIGTLTKKWREGAGGDELLLFTSSTVLSTLPSADCSHLMCELACALNPSAWRGESERAAQHSWFQSLAIFCRYSEQINFTEETARLIRFRMVESVVAVAALLEETKCFDEGPRSWPISDSSPGECSIAALQSVLNQAGVSPADLFLGPVGDIGAAWFSAREKEVDTYMVALERLLKERPESSCFAELWELGGTPKVPFLQALKERILELVKEGQLERLVLLAHLPDAIIDRLDLSDHAQEISAVVEDAPFARILSSLVEPQAPVSAIITRFCVPSLSPAVIPHVLARCRALTAETVQQLSIDDEYVGNALVSAIDKIRLSMGDLIIEINRTARGSQFPYFTLRPRWKNAVAPLMVAAGPEEFYEQHTKALALSLQALPCAKEALFRPWSDWKARGPATFSQFVNKARGEKVDRKEVVRSAFLSSIDKNPDAALERHLMAFGMAEAFVKVARDRGLDVFPRGAQREQLVRQCRDDVTKLLRVSADLALERLSIQELDRRLSIVSGGAFRGTLLELVPPERRSAFLQYFRQWEDFDEEPFPYRFGTLLDHETRGLSCRAIVWLTLLYENRRELGSGFVDEAQTARIALKKMLAGTHARAAELFRLIQSFRSFEAVEKGAGAPASSGEFHDYREYSTGDDLRGIDWNVWARSDRFMVHNRIEQERLKLMYHVDLEWLEQSSFEKPSKRLTALVSALAMVDRNGHRAGVNFYFRGTKLLAFTPDQLKSCANPQRFSLVGERYLPWEQFLRPVWDRAATAALYRECPLGRNIPPTLMESGQLPYNSGRNIVHLLAVDRSYNQLALKGLVASGPINRTNVRFIQG